MLRVVVRVDRAGEARSTETLGELEIWNAEEPAGEGLANYVAELKLSGQEPRRGRVVGFPRRLGAWQLVRDSLELFEDHLPRKEAP